MTDELVQTQAHILSVAEARASIMALENALKNAPVQIQITPRHFFAPGIYLREITIPEGVTLTGRIHLTDHYCILSQGEVVLSDGGGEPIRITAPATLFSKYGAKRAIHAVKESVWTNIHTNPDNITDLEELERILTVESYAELDLKGVE